MTGDDLKPKKPVLDPNTRVLLGRQLRDYYDRMRQTTVSDSLAQLLCQFEITERDDDSRTASPASPTPQGG